MPIKNVLMSIGNGIEVSRSNTTARRKRYWCLPETISGIPEAARLLVGKGIDTYRKLYRGFKKIYIGDWDVFSTFYRIILRSPCIRFRMFTFLSAYYQAEVLSENLQTIRRIYLSGQGNWFGMPHSNNTPSYLHPHEWTFLTDVHPVMFWGMVWGIKWNYYIFLKGGDGFCLGLSVVLR